jgi:hypothetical protein
MTKFSHNYIIVISETVTKREERELERELCRNTETTRHGELTDPTGFELPDLLTCTTLHSNNLQNSSTHNA